MKSYTDLEQSKKLAEILPIESADMFYNGVQDLDKEMAFNIPIDGRTITVRNGHIITEKGIKANLLLPCWSLAALLDVLPKSLIYTPNQALDEYCCKNIMHDLETYRDNLVDACVEMIFKLKEDNLL